MSPTTTVFAREKTLLLEEGFFSTHEDFFLVPENRTKYGYDSRYRLVEVTQPDPDGSGPQTSPVWQTEYDDAGNVTKTIDPLLRATTYEYDRLNRNIRVTLPDATYTETHYDAAGNVVATIDALGNMTVYAYDNLDRLIQVTMPDPDGEGSQTSPVTTTQYDILGNVLKTIDPLGRETAFEYDHLGRQTKTTLPDPDGSGSQTSPVTQTVYDAVGNVVKTIDALGRETLFEYDGLGRQTKVTLPDPDGSGPLPAPWTQTIYDAASQVTAEIDHLGRRTDYAYDLLGRNTSVTLPSPDGIAARPVTYTEYDAVRSVTAQVDALGNRTTFGYDNLYRRTSTTDAANGVSQFAFNAAGELTSTTDPLGRTTAFEYDLLGRTAKVTQPDPDGSGDELAPWTVFAYDAVGNTLSQTDRLDHATTYQYDNLSRRIRQTDANGGVTQYTFDAVGNTTSLTDPVGNTTTWTYDGLNRMVAETNELNATRSFEYNAVGDLVRRVDRNGRVIAFDYDNLDRQTAERWLDEQGATIRTISYTFDSGGRLAGVADPSASYGFSFDRLDRATGTSQTIAGLGATIAFANQFNANGQRTQLATTIGMTGDFVNDFYYDANGRTTSIQQHGTTGGNAVAEKRVDFVHDAASQWQSITRYADLGATQLVATSTYGHDQTGRLIALSHAKGQNTLAAYSWQFNAASRMTQMVSPDGTNNFTNDDTGQLTGASLTNEAYSYDDNGNRTNTGYATGANNQMLSDGTFTYTYDSEGNRTARFIDADSSGTITTGDTDITTYTWDYRNRLTQVVNRATAGGSPTQIVDYIYDAFNRRIGSLYDTNGDSAIDREERYVWDGAEIVLDFVDADGEGTQESLTLSKRYLWGPAVDQLLAQETPDDGGVEDVRWALTDHLNTVRDLAAFDGVDTTIVTHFTYDTFGNVTATLGTITDCRFLFTGQEYDVATAHYYYNARWYDPATGKFVSEDPIGFRAGTPNLGRYVGNSPTNATDPSGLQEKIPPINLGPFEFPFGGSKITPAFDDVPIFSRANDDMLWLMGRVREIRVYGKNQPKDPAQALAHGHLLKEANRRLLDYARMIKSYYEGPCLEENLEARLKSFGEALDSLDELDAKFPGSNNQNADQKAERARAALRVLRAFFAMIETRGEDRGSFQDRLEADIENLLYLFGRDQTTAAPPVGVDPLDRLERKTPKEIPDLTKAAGDKAKEIGLELLQKGFKENTGIGSYGNIFIGRQTSGQMWNYWFSKRCPKRSFRLPDPNATTTGLRRSGTSDSLMDLRLLELGIHLVDPNLTGPAPR